MKKHFFYPIFLALFLGGSCPLLRAQTGFVHASGTNILDNQGNNLIFRGIGTGNWLLQEGYMMNTSGATNGTQWDFWRKLVNTIGEEKTQEFYNAWWDKHFSGKDVAAMAQWGFNSVRVALHYKIFTLPIEQEPVQGQDTWLEDGFVRVDSLLKWCADNNMYLILDMHGCPGAQGDDSNISDYNPAYPSLWQSEENKRKLIALWTKLAKRYADSPWIGAYDLINEPKWTLPNNNKDLWDLQRDITLAIRTVDTHHLIFIEGNNWGNDYSGLPATLWDNNMGMSFHKYWTTLGNNSIDGIINNGKNHNCPIWLGESGENSNSWFAELIRVCEDHNVGWSWWPVKKTGNNNVLTAKGNTPKYNQLLTAWRNHSSIDATTAFEGVMEFADGHAFDNCKINYDVIDAMITRPHTNETRPFKNHTAASTIYAVDYDLGNIGYAYFDKVDATYSNNPYTTYQSGGKYRNDGVDIESCTDNSSNGYNVGWIEDGEWLKYTIESPETKAYNVELRYASQSGGGKVYIEINGERASKTMDFSGTGGWTTWQTNTFTHVVVPAGKVEVKVIFEKGGINFNYFKFTSGRDVSGIDFELLSANTDKTKDELSLFFNKPVEAIDKTAFAVTVSGKSAEATKVSQETNTPCKVTLSINEPLLQTNTIRLSYTGATCMSEGKALVPFSNFVVTNNLAQHFTIPSKIEAEDYADKNGFEFETCTDVGGGQNAAYTVAGNYLDYIVLANYTGQHVISLRTSGASANKQIDIYTVGEPNTLLATVKHIPTSGWQSWRTHNAEINLNQGKNILRIYAATDGFNFNWLELTEIATAGTNEIVSMPEVLIFPNPATEVLHVKSSLISDLELTLFDVFGKQVFKSNHLATKEPAEINVSRFANGIYFLKIQTFNGSATKKITIF
jgi:hypothetical protein